MAMAGLCLAFDSHFKKLDKDFLEAATRAGFVGVHIWDTYFVHAPGSDQQECLEVADGLGAPAGKRERWAQHAGELHELAQRHAPAAARRTGLVQGMALTADQHHHERCAERQALKRDLRVMEALAAQDHAALPTEWRGKRYRRCEGPTEQARADAERAERARKGKALAELLLEANLPAAHALRTSRGDDSALLRCCRGLSAKTLAQRLACWAPLRRWLLTQGLGPWPASAQPLLDYLETRLREGAARTTFSSLKAALSFLEEAGEVPPEERLSQDPALTNAVREAGLRAAQGTRKAGRGQAPQLPLVLLADLEGVVLDEGRATYQRAFAAFRLLRHWASLRWDDTQGLAPHTLKQRARGVSGLLERSKTSGPGKTNQVLPCFVSNEAWVHKPWLETGLRLLTTGSFAFERDFLLPLPNLKLTEATRRRALYSDAAAFSLALFSSLKGPTGEARLPGKAARFWSEHSDRAGLDSWTAALGVAQSERNFLGRWAASGSADSYVRTALRVVENLQRLAAKKAREAFAGGPDFFGEEHLFLRLRDFLVEQGWEPDAAILLAEDLKLCNYDLAPDQLDLPHGWAKEVPTPPAPEQIEKEDTIPLDPVEALHEEVVEPWGYVISITRGGKHRKLHHVGSCHRVPGVDYRTFEVWGGVLPPVGVLNSRCGVCFGTTALEPAEDVSDSESHTSSSETSGTEPADGEEVPTP